MTSYSPQELAEGWEFKILRSTTRAFRNPERLQRILSEEKRAGWILVEKFDDGRIRLKRPATAREMDGKLDFDPYRAFVGPSESKVGVIVFAVVLGIVAGMLALVAVLNAR